MTLPATVTATLLRGTVTARDGKIQLTQTSSAGLMNTGTLVGSLIFASVLVVVVAFLIHLMLRGWRHRAKRQVAIVGQLPSMPETVGPAVIPGTKGLYVGSTLAPSWQDRIAAGDLGFRPRRC